MTRPLPATFKPEHTVLGHTTGLNGQWAAYVIPGASAAMADAEGFRRYFAYTQQSRFAVMIHEPDRPDAYYESFPTLADARSNTVWLVLWRGRATRLPWQDWLRQTRQCGQQGQAGEQ